MAQESGSFWQLERANRRRTVTLVAALILMFAGFGLGLDFLFHTVRFRDGRVSGIPWFTAAAVILAVAKSMRANFAGADLVLGAMGAHPILDDLPNNQTVIDVVREMALAARIPAPRIDVIDDPSPNAFAIGRDPEHSVICVTQGLLDQMDREELQGVIAHEMAHIRNCDIRLTTMVTMMFGGFGGFSGLVFGFPEPSDWNKGRKQIGIVSRVISIILSREREYLADASAVEFTRNPKALIRALEQIAKTESPLRCATQSTAQLFIVDPFESATGGGGRSYQEFINEVTRIRSQPGKTPEQRDEEARNFAATEYPRNLVVETVSSHPPLRERIARLQALIGAAPGAAAASRIADDQLRAQFSESVRFVRNAAKTDPEVAAKVLQSALLASEGGRQMLQERFGGAQSAPESNAREPGALPPNLSGIPASVTGIGLPDSAASEALEVEALAKMLGPVIAGMRPKAAAIQPAATNRPPRSLGMLLFWLALAISAGALIAVLTTR
jgi:heat shock protein HtpX